MGVNRLWEQLDLPGESLPGQVLIEISGDNRVLIEHHRGVMEYGKEKICIKVKYGAVHITGTGLELCCMTREQLVITGRIGGICLMRRDCR